MALHPRLAQLIRDQGWTGFTPAQEAAAGPIAGGDHVLLMAPTGYGKTEAALLPVLSRLLDDRDAGRLARGFHVLYVTPLRALNRDLLGRLTSWGEALGLDIAVRHGDTTPSERARQSRRPPDVLITTPETVQLLLYGDRLRSHLAALRTVIVDEVHDLAASERGAQLAIALERIEEVIAHPETSEAAAKHRICPPPDPELSGMQRIGLSATVADPDAVSRFLAGRRQVRQVVVEGDKRIELEVEWPQPDDTDREVAAELMVPPQASAHMRAVERIVDDHDRVLVFQNTRDGAELLVNRLHRLGRGDGLELHHGSLSAEHRADVEDRFKAGQLRGLVCTSSLELGIDVGAIDHVVQVQSPRAVARMVQRLGRAGHRVGAVSAGTLVAAGAEDAMECLAVARMAQEGRLEPTETREAPLLVLANQIIAVSNEYAELDADWTRTMVMRAGPYLEMDEGLFSATWDALADLRTMFTEGDRITRSGRGRRHFLDHIGVIPDERSFRVVDEASKRGIGSVDESFVAAGLRPGAVFVMAGRSWQVLEIEAEEARVRVAAAKDVAAAPQWAGSQLPVSFELAQEVGAIRGELAAGMHDETIGAPVREHLAEGLEVPTHETITMESGREGLVINVCLGTRGNEALGRLTAALLQQRLDQAVPMESDAYRIHLRGRVAPSLVDEAWDSLDPASVDIVLGLILRDSPLLRHHVVHVGKQFGGLPTALDPTRTTRKTLDALMSHTALAEETMARLLHERLDVGAVSRFLHHRADGRLRFVTQAVGPISRLGGEEQRRLLAPPRPNEKVLAAVRERIESADVLMACTNCGHHWDAVVRDVPRAPRCRRCSSGQVACLRPWNKDQLPILRRKRLGDEERVLKKRLVKNAQVVQSFGDAACRALVARGIGPDTAGRILQKVRDPEDLRFWREILEAELVFARTNAFWRR